MAQLTNLAFGSHMLRDSFDNGNLSSFGTKGDHARVGKDEFSICLSTKSWSDLG